MIAAIGVFAAPAKRATMPMAAKVAGSTPRMAASRVPKVAPTKKMGVTMPPLPPNVRVMQVNSIFAAKAYHTIFEPASAASMVLSPSPR